MNRILIVDDDRRFAGRLAGALEGIFRVEKCHSEAEFRQHFAVGRFDLVIIDMRLEKDREGLDLLKEVLAQDSAQAAIVMTAYADVESYTDALASGALTYLDKHEFSPVLIARTVEAIVQQVGLGRRVAALERRLDASTPTEIIGVGEPIRQVRDAIRRAADDGRAPVLIVGPPGAGKKLAAANIHRLSRRRSDGPLLTGACGRLAADALGTVIFGHFQRLENGRNRETKGWVDEARGGVLVLEGLSAADDTVVSALVDCLRTGFFQRTGGGRSVEADVQLVVCITADGPSVGASGRVPGALIEKEGGIEIRLPALHERIEDIPLLAQYALQNLHRAGQTHARSFRGAALAVLESLPWPGNVRELNSAVAYSAIRADANGDREIGPEHLPQSLSDAPSLATNPTAGVLDYQLHLARAELGLVEAAIARFEIARKTDLAEHLRYRDRFTFVRRMRRIMEKYPALAREFPKVRELFEPKKERP